MAPLEIPAELRAKKPVEQIINQHLGHSEHVLWQDRPIPKYAFWSSFPGESWITRITFLSVVILAMQPFSLAGFYFTWKSLYPLIEFESLGTAAAGIALSLVGLALALGPYYYIFHSRIKSFRNSKDIVYLITNRRVLILLIREGRVVDEHTKQLRQVSKPVLRIWSSTGIGDVIFDYGGNKDTTGESASTHFGIGFEGIANAKAVMDILLTAIQDTTKPKR